MSRGQKWGSEEVRALIEIWADETVAQMLVETQTCGSL